MTDEQGTDVEIIDAEVLDESGGVVANLDLRAQMEFAVAHPRSIEAVKKDLYELATMDTEAADSMYYHLKRAGKPVEGPSIRFAECLIYAMGHIATGGKVTEIGATTLQAEGVAMDMQRGSRVARQVQRPIMKANGDRYSRDMINTTGMAAISIAIRNCVLTLVPRSIWQEAYNAALEVASGKGKDFKRLREEWLKWWEDQGGTEDQLWQWLDVKGKNDIGGFEMRSLAGFRTGIKEGHTTFQREMDILAGNQSGEEEADALDAKLMGDEE